MCQELHELLWGRTIQRTAPMKQSHRISQTVYGARTLFVSRPALAGTPHATGAPFIRQ